jgi:hypothetical protein
MADNETSAGRKASGDMSGVAKVAGGKSSDAGGKDYNSEISNKGEIDQKAVPCRGPRYPERDGH